MVLSKNFLSHRTEKTSPGSHSVFQKFSGREKILWISGGVITIFRPSFCLTVPNIFIGEHFGLSKKFFYRTISRIGGGASWFSRKF